MSIEARYRPARDEPEGALVLFHGRATDENDLYPLLDVFDPQGRLFGATPRGPLTLPPGGRHWYAVREIGYPDPETFHSTYAQVSDWLDALPEESGVPIGRTVLGGFSQGTVMSYALGLGKGRPRPAGILALSGFIPTVESWEIDLDRLEDFPVLIAHGTHDPVIGVEWGRDARDRLEAAGADVTYMETPVTHTIDPRIIPAIREWVHATVARAAATDQ
jgi:phospholipase/carboxylesterase